MKASLLTLALASTVLVAACSTTPTNPTSNPPAGTMSFKQGARYQFDSYQTDPSTGDKITTTEQTRSWTLVNASASAYGRTGVAAYVDSLLAGGALISVTDSVLYQESSGSNDVYRYASLAPDLDLSTSTGINLNLGQQWMHEAQLNATTANWFTGEAADTIQVPGLSIPGLAGVRIGVTDSATASSTESVSVGGTSYTATKTVHTLRFSISALIAVPLLGTQSFDLTTASLSRTTWMVPSLGAIVQEDRQNKVIDVSGSSVGGVSIPSFSLPLPGYHSQMTAVLATGA